MIIKSMTRAIVNKSVNTEFLQGVDVIDTGLTSYAGKDVTVESSKTISTAYRCINVLSDDLAKMPLQTFISRAPGQVERVRADFRSQNIAWLMEISPNRWMTPFIFKKLMMTWLITWGNAYAWMPPRRAGARREIFVLNSSTTTPVYDEETGRLSYETLFPDGETYHLPDVEVLHLLINSAEGVYGKSVVTYARESIGRQMGAYETQGKFYKQGLNPSGILWMNGKVDRKEARDKIRTSFESEMSGSDNAYRLAIMDTDMVKFEPITMKPVDTQFLESINATDVEIANFFGMPLYKLNMGKQAYNSNEQQDLDYLKTTLDPYLVQWEQAAAIRWLTEAEQNEMYLRFNRDALLRTDAASRAALIEKRIFSGVLTPNEGRQIDDLPAYPGGDNHYIPANMVAIGGADGK